MKIRNNTKRSIETLWFGTNYYRLNQVDIDGKSELSPIVQVKYYPKWAPYKPKSGRRQSALHWSLPPNPHSTLGKSFWCYCNIRKSFFLCWRKSVCQITNWHKHAQSKVYSIRFLKQGAMQAPGSSKRKWNVSPFNSSPIKWIAVIHQRAQSSPLNGSWRYPSIKVQYWAGFIIGSLGPRTSEWLLAKSTAPVGLSLM